jgi:hypothetical protein
MYVLSTGRDICARNRILETFADCGRDLGGDAMDVVVENRYGGVIRSGLHAQLNEGKVEGCEGASCGIESDHC